VGFVSLYREDDTAGVVFRDSILEGLADKGLEPGRTMEWLPHYADNVPARVGQAANALVEQGVDAITTIGASTVGTVGAVRGRVPVIYGYSGDPIAAGLAATLAQPWHNATGVTIMAVETNAKRVEILKEMAPQVRKIALISSPNHPGEAGELEVCRRAVVALGVDLHYMPVFNTQDLDKAIAQSAESGADALMALPDGVTTPSRARLAAAALTRRIPSGSGWSMFADSGMLMTFGPNPHDSYRRVGNLAAQVLSGARPADLPIEQPTKFELVVNQATARAIGLAVPPRLLARADRVIE
jgi:putative ABC transport system substrate-binding protein